MAVPTVSIVVPVLNEATVIGAQLDYLHRWFGDCEIIVADGGSGDNTAALAEPRARVVVTAPGRSRQLNAGAQAANGEVLWFVHADAQPAPAALAQLRRALTDPDTVGGGCKLRFDRNGPALAWVRWTSNLRARHLHWIFGDQALFVRRSIFIELGGFPELPIMEDLELSRRLHRRGRLVLLDASCTASARRFIEHGTLRMLVLMQYLKVQYFLGVDPQQIHHRYVTTRRRPR